jgi:hypothetical protein
VKQLPKIVRARLSALDTSEHPDADLLTAFSERALWGRERDRVLNHLCGCAECRQVVVLALPELTEEEISGPIQSRPFWLRTPVLRWGTLAACVVVVGAAVLLHKGEQSSPGQEMQVALQQPAPSGPAIHASSEAPVLPNALPKSEAKASDAKAKVHRAPVPSAPERMGSANNLASAANAPISADAAFSDRLQKSENVEVQAGAVTADQAPVRADEQLRARNSAAAAKAAPLFTARPTTETAASTIDGDAKLTDLRPPSWRLSQDGLPERSFASGQWEKVQIDHKTGFRAIAAQGMEVWIGGPGGLLYHSEDMGLNWTRVIPVSSSATLTDDIAGILFSDHMHGKLETGGGQNWITSDAGKTWEVH